MKVTKEMHNKGLQPTYAIMKMSSRLIMNRIGISLLNANSARSKGRNIEGIEGEERFIPSRNGGPDIRVRIFRPAAQTENLPGMLYIHGGGYLLGNPEDFLSVIKRFIDARPCVVVAPDYRKAYDAPYPAAFNDCYDTLLWMNENVKQLGIIPNKLIIAGHSSGGGLTAAVTLKATDTGDVKLAFQIPIYPMLDDRQNSESAKDNNSAGWNAKSNKLGWSAYLRNLVNQGAEIPPYAAAARAKDYSKLPPTITFVGDLEPFRDETIDYVDNLKKAGVPVIFELFPGCYHAFEVLFPEIEISKKAWSFLMTTYAAYVDQFIYSNKAA
ncbi:MAG: alpha/beta hydrolase [Imperialibacter sp.]|uniref:alpha/beta hydrolase n=1 Tax=Imperialibacter sp. TaxID=2038411 RepID=UPI0032EE731A